MDVARVAHARTEMEAERALPSCDESTQIRPVQFAWLAVATSPTFLLGHVPSVISAVVLNKPEEDKERVEQIVVSRDDLPYFVSDWAVPNVNNIKGDALSVGLLPSSLVGLGLRV